MAQPTLLRVLNDIRTLEPAELSAVERAVQEWLETSGYFPAYTYRKPTFPLLELR